MLKCVATFAIFPLALVAQLNTTLSPRATEAFDAYLKAHEPQINHRARYAQLKPGEIRVDPGRESGSINVSEGLLHDWVGATLVPGATVEQALSVLQNYPAYKQLYAPEVTDSRLLSH